VSRYQKGKTNLDLLEQETVSGSGISWAICKSAPCPRQPHQNPTLSFFTGGCPSCRPTNSIKALKAQLSPLWIAYIDLKATFDSTNWEALWLMILSLDLPSKLVDLFKALYNDTFSCIHADVCILY